MAQATREPNEFQPITITIETADEAEALWHRLNVGVEQRLTAYYQTEGVDAKRIEAAADVLFNVCRPYLRPWRA